MEVGTAHRGGVFILRADGGGVSGGRFESDRSSLSVRESERNESEKPNCIFDPRLSPPLLDSSRPVRRPSPPLSFCPILLHKLRYS